MNFYFYPHMPRGFSGTEYIKCYYDLICHNIRRFNVNIEIKSSFIHYYNYEELVIELF